MRQTSGFPLLLGVRTPLSFWPSDLCGRRYSMLSLRTFIASVRSRRGTLLVQGSGG